MSNRDEVNVAYVPSETISELYAAVRCDPYSIITYCERSRHYVRLGYPDLAVMDIYKALLLSEDLVNGGEYHVQALAATLKDMQSNRFDHRLQRLVGYMRIDTSFSALRRNEMPSPSTVSEQKVIALCRNVWCLYCPITLAHHLATIGCLRTAAKFVDTMLRASDGNCGPAIKEKQRIDAMAYEHVRSKGTGDRKIPSCGRDAPDHGTVRREIYDWNDHESERLTDQSVAYLNDKLRRVSGKLEVRLTELPVLRVHGTSAGETTTDGETTKQLGLFATEDIKPGEPILRERSLLATNARLLEPLCDACSSPLPRIGEDEIYDCDECDDIAFCSATCKDLAMVSYHGGICGVEVEDVGKHVSASQAADSLYTQLLFRAMSMSICQDKHPLELEEIKFLWGDFDSIDEGLQREISSNHDEYYLSTRRGLPYNFQSQVVQPLHLLELLDVNIFEAPHDLAETWVYNTLYAKFRGTASSRISPRDGRPEVAAVHPIWSLANHSCSPNVTWDWAADIKFVTRTTPVKWSRNETNGTVICKEMGHASGIAKGQEVLNHYVDIDLPVAERRAWASGALGGSCICDRCKWEDTT